MHDINFIRENPIQFDNAMKQRGENPLSKKILEIDLKKRNTQTLLQNLLAERNELSKKIGEFKSKNKDCTDDLKRVEKIKLEINTLKELENLKNDELKTVDEKNEEE